MWQNIPLTSVEDTAGEFVLSIFGKGSPRQDLAVDDPQSSTAPIKLVTKNASVAQGAPGNTIIPPSTYTPPETDTDPISCEGLIKIMPIGDSITVGSAGQPNPGSTYPGYRGYLENNLTLRGFDIDYVGNLGHTYTLIDEFKNTDDQHQAKNGENTKWVLDGIDVWVGLDPDIILLHIGSNNLELLQGEAGEGIPQNIANVKAIIEKINKYSERNRADKPVSILISTIQLGSGHLSANSVGKYNDELKKLGTTKNVTIVSMPQIQLSDGVHPTAIGYKTMSDTWATNISTICR